MRDLHDILEKALHNSAYCDDCPNHTPHKEICDIPQHQGVYTTYSCRIAETGGAPKECPDVQEYLRQYQEFKDSISMADICRTADSEVVSALENLRASVDADVIAMRCAVRRVVLTLDAAREQMVDEEV